MSYHRFKEIPRRQWGRDIMLDKITVKRDSKGILTAIGGTCLITPELLEQISDYTRSQPTGPSAGRIYRKALNWPALYPDQYPERFKADPDPNWHFYLCVPTPDHRPKYAKSVDHVPFKVVLL